MKIAQIDEAITDAKNMKFLYFAMTKIMGLPESAEGLKECEDSMQALNDLRFKVIAQLRTVVPGQGSIGRTVRVHVALTTGIFKSDVIKIKYLEWQYLDGR